MFREIPREHRANKEALLREAKDPPSSLPLRPGPRPSRPRRIRSQRNSRGSAFAADNMAASMLGSLLRTVRQVSPAPLAPRAVLPTESPSPRVLCYCATCGAQCGPVPGEVRAADVNLVFVSL